MAYTRYPRLRNYKKRCEIYTQRLELEKLRATAKDAAFKLDDDEFDNALDAIEQQYDPMINYLWRLEFSLEFPETRNKWFCDIIKEKGIGCHEISKKQAYYFSQYCEENENSWRTHESYCRAAGYFCTLHQWNGGAYLKIEEVKEPESANQKGD